MIFNSIRPHPMPSALKTDNYHNKQHAALASFHFSRLCLAVIIISYVSLLVPGACASALKPIKFRTEEAFRAHGHHEESKSVEDFSAKLEKLREKRQWKKWNLRNPDTKARLDKLLDMSYGGAQKRSSSNTRRGQGGSSGGGSSKMEADSHVGDSLYRHHKPPNILFILADDLGYGDLSVMPFVTKYSSDWPCDEGGILSPQLEAMAKRGLIMTNFHSSAPVCSPSRVAFMTGVSPWRLGALNAFELGQDLSQRNGFLPQVATVAEIFRENGYYTFHSGKWHLGGMREEYRVDRVNHSNCAIPGPNQHGFEEYISELDGPESPRYTFNLLNLLHSKGHRTLYRDDIPVPYDSGNEGFLTPWSTNTSWSYPPVKGSLKAFDALSKRYYPFKGVSNPNPSNPDHQYVLSDREAMDALEFIRRHQADQPDQPFFAQVWLNAPHGPWERLYAGEDVYNDILQTTSSHWSSKKCTWHNKDENLVDTKLWQYKTMVTAMDRSIGLLLSGLEELGLEKDTLVVFTSDNGPEQGAGTGGRYKQSKRSLQEGGIRVPAIFQWVGKIPANSASTAWAAATDLLPTLLDAAGIPLPPNVHMDGFTLMPLLMSGTPLSQDSAYRRSSDAEANNPHHQPDAKELEFLKELAAIHNHYLKESNSHHHNQHESSSAIHSNSNTTYRKNLNWPFSVDKTRYRLYLWHKDTERWNGIEERFQSSAYFDDLKIITSTARGCLDKIYDLRHDPFEDVNLINSDVRAKCEVNFASTSKNELIAKSVSPRSYDRHCQLTTKPGASAKDCTTSLHDSVVKKIQMMFPKLAEFVLRGNSAHRVFQTKAICTVPLACEVAPISYPPSHYFQL